MIQRLTRARQHLPDSLVAGSKLLVNLLRDIAQIFGQKQLVIDFSRLASSNPYKMPKFTAIQPHGSLN